MWVLIATVIGLVIAGVTLAILWRPTEDRPFYTDQRTQLESNARAIERNGHEVDVTWNWP